VSLSVRFCRVPSPSSTLMAIPMLRVRALPSTPHHPTPAPKVQHLWLKAGEIEAPAERPVRVAVAGESKAGLPPIIGAVFSNAHHRAGKLPQGSTSGMGDHSKYSRNVQENRKNTKRKSKGRVYETNPYRYHGQQGQCRLVASLGDLGPQRVLRLSVCCAALEKPSYGKLASKQQPSSLSSFLQSKSIIQDGNKHVGELLNA
jgi:hypothetical protein